MEIKITVPAEYIAVLKLFTADRDMRRALNGINLEIGAKESRLVATNGHMLGCFRIESEQPEVNTPLGDIIIPNELLKLVKAKGTVEITIGPLETEANGEGVSVSRPVTLTHAGMSVHGKTVNGTFPEWRKTIPTRVTGEPAQFNTAYTGDLAKAYIALHGGKGMPFVALGFNGNAAALIDLNDANFFGILMPMRVDAPVSPPDWWADSLYIATDSADDLV
jgi:DNA polymerase-3 subunit beta